MPLIPENVSYFERIDPDANMLRFWAFRFVPAVKGTMAVRFWWGRIGTKGQEKTLDFDSDNSCLEAIRRRVEDKLREGYKPVKGAIAWVPEFMKQANREPTTPTPAGIRGPDGWPVVNGREMRPPSGRGRVDLAPPPRPIERAPSPRLDTLAAFQKARARVTTTVTLTTERVIDFEE